MYRLTLFNDASLIPGNKPDIAATDGSIQAFSSIPLTVLPNIKNRKKANDGFMRSNLLVSQMIKDNA
jgi:hypothetical protein